MNTHTYEAEREQAAQIAELSRRQREYERKRLELRNAQADQKWRALNLIPVPIDETISPFSAAQ
jgi:uncharacterized protein YjiS (DUF1127 family)